MGSRVMDRQGTMSSPDPAPTWATPSEIPGVVLHRPHLKRTLITALVVGSVLFAINQADVVMKGDATAVTWLKTGLTYLVPFVVSNLGVLFASKRGDR